MYNILIACDSKYYKNWAINCIKSIQLYAPWISITVVLVNPDTNFESIPNVKYHIDRIEFPNEESKVAYFQAVRFLKCSEIFPNNELVMAIDCDTVLTRSFTEKEFRRISTKIHVQRHHKADRWMAGLVTFGDDSKFRNYFKEQLLQLPLEKWEYGWDQKILNNLNAEFQYIPLQVGDWMSFGKGGGIFLTLKGSQKYSEKYLKNFKKIIGE